MRPSRALLTGELWSIVLLAAFVILNGLTSTISAQNKVATDSLNKLPADSIVFEQQQIQHLISPGNAAWRSAVLPGWGQFKLGRKAKGTAFIFGMGCSSLLTIDALIKYHRKPPDQRDKNGYRNALLLTGIIYSLNVLDAAVTAQVGKDKKPHSPIRAAYQSLLIPGWGQWYNKKWWKIPIVYGALGTAIYFIIDNNRTMNAFAEAYRNLDNPNFIRDAVASGYTETGLVRAYSFYKRNRDLSVLVLSGLYLLNVIDATVDAHLYNFDVSDDLSMKIEPAVIPTSNSITGGVSVSFSF